MTNSIGTRATSLLGNASSMLSSARDAFKAMADAAVNNPGEPSPVAATAASKGRRGTVLDRYA